MKKKYQEMPYLVKVRNETKNDMITCDWLWKLIKNVRPK